MFNVSTFLEKFSKFKNPAEDKDIASQIIEKISGITLSKNELSFQGKNLSIQTSPMKRQEILLQEQAILQHLKDSLPTRVIEAIR